MENSLNNLNISEYKKIPVLVGDVGGTNGRLSIVRMSSVI